ncbi:unnamed protein product [Durusdinium trenchii]|uniref:Uncharacterized protein n=1 Tax=Durusdinium trenchii TaxID=1381693 RepID=A0ABP0KFB8_9DINO
MTCAPGWTSEVTTQHATTQLFGCLLDGAPVRVAPTALFDDRGMIAQRIRSCPIRSRRRRRQLPKWQRHRWHVIRGDAATCNLLSLFADWRKRVPTLRLGDRVCIGSSKGQLLCHDAQSFEKLIEQLGRQEAQVRADTYEPNDAASFLRGPFFLQAYVEADEDLEFVVEFRRSTNVEATADTFRSRVHLQASAMRFSQPQRGGNDDADDRDGLFVLPDSVDRVTHAQLISEMQNLISYIATEHTRCIGELSATWIRAVHGGEQRWILRHVCNLTWGPFEPSISQILVNDAPVSPRTRCIITEQQQQRWRRRQRTGGENQRGLRAGRPQSAGSFRPGFKPSAVTPKDRTTRQGFPKGKALHNFQVTRPGQHALLVRVSGQLAKALRLNDDLHRRISSLEHAAVENQTSLLRCEEKARQARTEKTQAEEHCASLRGELEGQVAALVAGRAQLAEELKHAQKLLDQEQRRRKLLQASEDQLLSRVESLQKLHDTLAAKLALHST